MNDSTIIITITIPVLFILMGIGIIWFFFIHLPRTTMVLAGQLVKTTKEMFGFTPQITVNQKVIYKQTREILELAIVEQDFEVDIESKDKWLGSEKILSYRGIYRAKIGFDLTKGFAIEILSGQILKPRQVIFYMPGAEILSIETIDIQRRVIGGVINWISENDREFIDKELEVKAKDRASKLEMIEDAERRIENRLTEFLLTKLNYSIEHSVKFIKPINEEEIIKQNENGRLLLN